MPTYEYACRKCRVTFEEERSIVQGPRKKCPGCRSGEPTFCQLYSAPFCIIFAEPTTFGQQAERNAKRVGKEQMQLMVEQSKIANRKAKTLKVPKGGRLATEVTKPATPWWRPGTDQPLDVSKLKNVRRFIETGVAT